MKFALGNHQAASGGIRLALAALLLTPLALPAEEWVPPQVKAKGKGKEEVRAGESARTKEPERPGSSREAALPARPGPRPPATPVQVPAPPKDPVGELHPASRQYPQRVPPVPGVGGHGAPGGPRHLEVTRPDGRVVFAEAHGHGGYIQHPFRVHDQTFLQRTYVERGVVSVRIYRPWTYRGVTYQVYQPSRYYRPGYYRWACSAWARPVQYPWGWANRPWYGYYRGYVTPYPFYTSPVFWLTDFMVAATLEEAYQTRLDDGAAAPTADSGGGLTPEAKQAIADEVRLQLEQERAEQQTLEQGAVQPAGAPPPLFSSGGARIFLVFQGVPAFRDGVERQLTEGDVLQFDGAPAAQDGYAEVRLLASRTPDCPRGSLVSVRLTDLQEMQNHMRATLDSGLGELQARQGQAGLPAPPAQDLGSAAAPFAGGLEPEANAPAELARVAQEAGTIRLGMTLAEVQGVLGSPRQTALAGARRIDVYPDFRITFVDGVVTDIQ